MNIQTTRRVAAVGMAGAAALATAGFTALGSLFDYPKILKESTAHILTSFRAHDTAVVAWFVVLTVSAALLAPVGILLGRLADGRLGRWIVGVGIAAAAVQVIGLSRWALFVPSIADDSVVPGRTAYAYDRFHTLHVWLGQVIGETIGYALTAVFTTLVVLAVTRHLEPRWLALTGYASAALIATGVLIPLGLDVASLTNFAGYLAWCVWLVAMAVVLWRTPRRTLSGSSAADSVAVAPA